MNWKGPIFESMLSFEINFRLNDQMSGIERRIADADPLTKALLGTSAEILTKNPSPQSEKTPSKP